ncbi:GPI transamidase-like protein component Gpi16 [Erysiphe pulchra]|uniref:GPI transamidase-like protein component Gpi16 n=1 Tax=Erysiphe pulchra TaxID=225359 RepID=A0A2S4PZP0_9PEZI|nr:GPI transamidase-like protein component Gpi16 [Erysiphe pulchra]
MQIFFIPILLFFNLQVISSSDYHERLILRPLNPSLLLASFQFKSNSTLTEFDQQNFRYFPRSLGQILKHANTKELHLRFSLGRWDAERWGARPWGGSKEGGTGVELWAWIEAETKEKADEMWLTLTNALSGLFCASLNFIDATKTTRPIMTFQPSGKHAVHTLENLNLLHGALPGEVVCTENLTPFLKLLPCKAKAGISSLLDGHKLFDANWQSMSIDVLPICSESGACQLQIIQTIDMVLDIQRSKRPRHNPIPRPIPREELICDQSKSYNSDDTCLPLNNSNMEEKWSLSEIFGRQLKGSCPLATDNDYTVCIIVPHSREIFTSASSREHKNEGGDMRCYELAQSEDFEMLLPQQEISEKVSLEQPLLYAERSFTGYGQERGGVQAILMNPSPTNSIEMVYFETLPWFMKPYLHTLKARINGLNKDIIREMYYRPALDRKRGTLLEIKMLIPANSTVVLTYDFEKAILRYTEYPPDANRGFDVAPAVITIGNFSIRTTSLLLPLPTPDFSMPYNVIILTSTVMALTFGFIFNMIVRRFVALDEAEKWNFRALRFRLAAAIKMSLGKFLTKIRNYGKHKKTE